MHGPPIQPTGSRCESAKIRLRQRETTGYDSFLTFPQTARLVAHMDSSIALPPDFQPLIQQAIDARLKAYAPYSDFLVGAALLTADGQTFTGCNVENASYGLCICAERNAICQAVAHGHREFRAIAVAASPLAPPCGACRQFIVEFGKDITVITFDPADPNQMKIWTSDELIPESFSFE